MLDNFRVLFLSEGVAVAAMPDLLVEESIIGEQPTRRILDFDTC